MSSLGGNRSAEKTWKLELNQYQRDNLLWLIGLIGWWEPKLGPRLEPFSFANTGDWVGEIGCMLSPEDGHGRPNVTRAEIEQRVLEWQLPEDKRAEMSELLTIAGAAAIILASETPHEVVSCVCVACSGIKDSIRTLAKLYDKPKGT